MSQDLGSSSAGFNRNFVYNSLALANNTYVQFVDQSENTAGIGAEALYVNSLVVPAGTTLDLNACTCTPGRRRSTALFSAARSTRFPIVGHCA